MRDRRNKVLGRMHGAMYRASKGRVGAKMGKAPILLLTMTGRKSGQRRTVPLIYLRDGSSLVVVASNAGQDHHPAWFGNLLANPEAEVEIGGDRLRVRARVANDDERAALWPRLVGIFSWYASYERKTDRPIPVVILEPQ
jgi:deazaflavin-dependent oxidoreductase (nitroreductase family)